VDFLFVLIELFALSVGAQALRANTDWKSAFLKGVGQFQPNFYVVVDALPPRIIFSTDRYATKSFTTLSPTVFTRWNFVADFLQVKCNFWRETDFSFFEPPWGVLRDNVRSSS